jgi:hypothetical protein
MNFIGTRHLLAMLVVTGAAASALAAAGVSSQQSTTAPGDLGRIAGEPASVVEVILRDADELDRLVATGVDLDHWVERSGDAIRVRAVVTPSEAATLLAKGFQLGRVAVGPGESADRLEERDATLSTQVAENEAFAAMVAAGEASDVRILRADYYTSAEGAFLSVEAKWAEGGTSASPLTVERDSGPGTDFGTGGSQEISRFVDADVYLYHRGAAPVSPRPSRVRIVSPTGGVAEATVSDWLPLPGDPPADGAYLTDFVTRYLTPAELYERIQHLATDYPALAEVVELPYRSNGYRRRAQALLGTANPSRVGVDSQAWGHEGGNNITIAVLNPGVASSPLTVSVTGDDITVTLATDSTGVLTSTAAQVVAALNAHPAASALVFAYTFRGNAGTGVVAPAARTILSDFLHAPLTVSRDPHPVYALRIGRFRDGSRPGVLIYAQEHAREWVPPLVTIETAERLLRNYATHGPTRQLLNNLDIWIAPSLNPDGSHYSFYDFAFQRRSMTRHCAVTDSFDAFARNAWGVDNNRNYDLYSLFDGYSGASTSCTSDVFAGPSELSEPENRNLDWMASAHPHIRFAMNLHSSGNFLMWSPGSYATPGRITAPRPTLEEESFYWGASVRILTAVKAHRGTTVTPARTGPIADVLYSAAGNSSDMLWYKYRIFTWNAEIGSEFQPPFTAADPTAASAHQETLEFANGMIELLRTAYDFGRDRVRPESVLHVNPSPTPGMVELTFTVSEPAAVFYTLDGTVPTYASSLYGIGGIREAGERLTVPSGTTVHWFSVDSAGNVERNYRPDGTGRNYQRAVATQP